ncbi:acyltransferase [Dyadobacter sp. CY326]|uniref:acyltransferase family protein n=1 Tax=Dyadobacter sp. CY326 TaxID=2907300 RepID=UPI001F266F93|nr:acyltransferase [Dyadobacter sp. CY326]MCE7063866.1 acyltransferase [Dyadobacter sp. CY326]
MKSHSDKLIKLEMIRGFAAVYVAIGHTVKNSLMIANINFSYLFRFGQEAVILFFILSGIVIQYSFVKSENKSFQSFFLRRFLRIYVPLLLVFFTNYLLVYFSEGLAQVSWAELAGNILMLQDYSQVKPGTLVAPFLGNSPLWSLSYEWWFYFIFFALYSRFGSRSGRYAHAISIIAAISYFFYPTFAGRVMMYLTIWWAGADIALLYVRNEAITLKTLAIPLSSITAITIILGLNAYFNADKMSALLHDSGPGVSPILELRHFAFAFLIIPAALLWRAWKWIGFYPIFGVFKHIAPISFGIYISHFFLISNANYLANVLPNRPLQLIVYTLVCLIFSYVVERKIYPAVSQMFRKQTAPQKAALTLK